jgi:hypothetical protein
MKRIITIIEDKRTVEILENAVLAAWYAVFIFSLAAWSFHHYN